jgi:hypothetical protein
MDQIHKVFYILLLITRAPELAAAAGNSSGN